jgi:predicted alpha/beta-fold hydrolase
MFGFGTAANYYDKASCCHRIPQIRTPTFILVAEDDPVIGSEAIDINLCQSNPSVLLGTTTKGGHLGYYESAFSPKQWFVEPVFEFISHFNQNN